MLCLDEIQFLVQHQLCHTHRIIVQSLGVHIKMNNLTTTTSFRNRLFHQSIYSKNAVIEMEKVSMTMRVSIAEPPPSGLGRI